MASYFEQKEACNLFAPKSPPDEKVIMALNNQIKVLFEGTNKPDAWQGLINSGDEDNVLMPYQIECIKDRSCFILATLLYARENMGKQHQHWTFKKCCAMAVRDLNQIGLNLQPTPKLFESGTARLHATATSFLDHQAKVTKLKVDDIQHMVFVPTDDGPFWMSIKE